MKKFGIFLMILALAACAGDGSSDTDGDFDQPKKEKSVHTPEAKLNTDNLICPQVAILTEAQDHFDYGGEKANPAQLVSSAHMTSVEGDCAYRENGIDIAYTLHMRATRGPRLGGDQVSFPFYIAVIDPADNIVSRQVMTAHFLFSGTDKHTGDDEALHVFIPLDKTTLQGGPAYRVLMGFQR